MGNFIFKKSPSGEIILSQVPDMSNVKWSEAQTAVRERMTEANAYAQAAMADPEMRAYYEEKARRQSKKSPYRWPSPIISRSLKGWKKSRLCKGPRN